MSLPELRAGRTQSGKQHGISSFGIFSDCHATTWYFVAPEQRVLIEMLISGVCCCLPRAVRVMQQFPDSRTPEWSGWNICLPQGSLFLTISVVISYRELRGTRVARRQYGFSVFDCLFTFLQRAIAIMLSKHYSKTPSGSLQRYSFPRKPMVTPSHPVYFMLGSFLME